MEDRFDDARAGITNSETNDVSDARQSGDRRRRSGNSKMDDFIVKGLNWLSELTVIMSHVFFTYFGLRTFRN